MQTHKGNTKTRQVKTPKDTKRRANKGQRHDRHTKTHTDVQRQYKDRARQFVSATHVIVGFYIFRNFSCLVIKELSSSSDSVSAIGSITVCSCCAH